MAIYGLKDVSNLILVDKATDQPVMFIDYANATSSEWDSESVYATSRGTNAIRWDVGREGTLTVETELFDFNLLAMVLGADVKDGSDNIFERVSATVDESGMVEIGDGLGVDESTISVIKLANGENDVEHDGAPLFNETNYRRNLPRQVSDLTVSANDNTATISFGSSAGADAYAIYRDDELIAEGGSRSYTDRSLTPDTEYEYHVVATNSYGEAPASAKVTVKTSTEGDKSASPSYPTETQRTDALENEGTVASPNPNEPTFSYSDGIVTLTNTVPGDAYAIYFMKEVHDVRTLSIQTDKFPGQYEIFADGRMRRQDTGEDDLIQIHYFNAAPQSNFTLSQSATEPTSLTITFDLLADGNKLADFKVLK